MTSRPSLLALPVLLSVLQVASCPCSEPPGGGEGEGEGDGSAGEGESDGGEGEGDGGEGEGEPQGCTVDTECSAGERCVDATCVDAPCNSNADCGAGRACSSSTCVGAGCSDDLDCGTGHRCDAGTCVGLPCTDDTDCPSLLVCFADGTCGSSPVTDPYQAFCTGTGTIAGTGGVGSGDLCLGDLAEQTFRFGFCACGDLAGDGSIVSTDAFRSSDGPYGTAPTLTDGHVGVNGAFSMDARMLVGGSLVVGSGELVLPGTSAVSVDVYGAGSIRTNGAGGQLPVGNDVYVGGAAVANLDVGGRLFKADTTTGITSVNVAPANIVSLAVPPVQPCPCDAEQRVPIRALVDFARTQNDNGVFDDPNTPADESFNPDQWADPLVNGPATLELACGRYYVRGIEQEQGLTLRALDRTVLFVDGNFIANSLTISLADGAEVDIFVTGDLAFDAATVLGDITRPSAVRTYVDGELRMNASAQFGGLVYAPNADLVFSGATTVYGALFVHTATFGGNVAIHFDSSVRSAGDACEELPGEGEGEGEPGGEGEGEGEPGGEGEGEGEADIPCFACDSAGQCGDGACLIPPGSEFSGFCGPCATSLDCCFPATCDVASGACVLLEG
jgi:hypothetical protein